MFFQGAGVTVLQMCSEYSISQQQQQLDPTWTHSTVSVMVNLRMRMATQRQVWPSTKTGKTCGSLYVGQGVTARPMRVVAWRVSSSWNPRKISTANQHHGDLGHLEELDIHKDLPTHKSPTDKTRHRIVRARRLVLPDAGCDIRDLHKPIMVTDHHQLPPTLPSSHSLREA